MKIKYLEPRIKNDEIVKIKRRHFKLLYLVF